MSVSENSPGLSPSPSREAPHSRIEIFLVALRLGLTSFGGPVAHLGYFHSEYVERRKWLDEKTYADLMALCQFLPGPASSQLGFGIGMTRGGLLGGLLAWLGFTLPSALLMMAFGYGVHALGAFHDTGWLRGLKIAATAVVAQAVWVMAGKLCPDRTRATLAILATSVALLWPAAWIQILVIALGGLAGSFLLRESSAANPPTTAVEAKFSRAQGVMALALFFVIFGLLPAWTAIFPSQGVAYFDAYYRTGALVFGGGHVVLPLLKAEAVKPGGVDENTFLAGYGLAQALPGPLFAFAAYLGTVARQAPNGIWGGLICLCGIYLSPLLLLVGAMPFWEILRKKAGAQAALKGTNAAVVGVLLAAFYDPVWTSSVHGARDFVAAVIAFGLLQIWKCPPWLVVILAAICGASAL